MRPYQAPAGHRKTPATAIARRLMVLIPFVAALSWTGASRAQTPEIPDPPPPPKGARSNSSGSNTTASSAPSQSAAGVAGTSPEAAPAYGAQALSASVPSERQKETARLAPSPTGETGILRVASAESVRPGLIRLSFGLDFFSVGSFFADADGHSRVGGVLAVSGSPIDHLELWLNTRAQSNSDARTTPELLQSQGDLTLGAKGFFPIGDVGSLGADLQLTLLSGVGEASFDLSASQVTVRGLFTADLMKALQDVPVRAHVNAGFAIDNSEKLATAPLSNAERFALGISEFSRFLLGFAVEVPVKYVSPYLEYTIEFPLGYLATPGIVLSSAALRDAQAANLDVRECDPVNARGCARPAAQRAFPQRLTPGVRVTAIPNLTLDLAVEIGITPDVVTGVLATPPYNVVMLASYPLDPFGEGGHRGPPIAVPLLVPEVTEVEPAPTRGQVSGVVKSEGDGLEVKGAVVSFDRSPPVATSAGGLFQSHEMDPGPVAITISREGFETATVRSEVSVGETVEIEVTLVPELRQGTVRGRVLDEKEKPIPNVALELQGRSRASVVTGPDGSFQAEVLSGKYLVEANQAGFLRKAKEIDLKGGETVSWDLVLRKRPKQAGAEVLSNMIVLRQAVPFLNGEARLAPEAPAVLDHVVDVLNTHRQIKVVRIEGHTDNVGSEPANLQLSKDRAGAVLDYLVRQGIDRKRLIAEGLGAARPIAPNLTRRGREQNRRIEFHILEQ